MMRKTVLLAFVVMVLAPAMVLGQKQKPVQDKYAAFRDRKEFGVPLFNKIPILNKYFSNSAVSKDFVWSNRFGGVAVVSPDGHYLVTGSQSLDLWDLESPEKSRPDFANLGPMEFELKPDNPIIPQLCWLAFTQDGSQIALTYNEKLFFLDAANAKITRTIDLPKETVNWGRAMFGEMPFALSPCGKFFACDGREDGVSCLKVINTETGKEVFRKNLPAVTWHNLVSESHGKHSEIEIKQKPVEGQDVLVPPCFSPDGRHLFVALRHHGMEILDAKTGETVTALKVDGLAPDKKWVTFQAAFSPDGKYLVTTGFAADKIWAESQCLLGTPPAAGKILLWDAKTFQLLREWDIAGENGRIELLSVAFSPDGKQVLSAHIAPRPLKKGMSLLALIVTQFDVDTGQLLKTSEIKQSGATPLIPEFRPLCNSQAHGIHWYPETFDFDISFRSEK